jgi:hypothetical protein
MRNVVKWLGRFGDGQYTQTFGIPSFGFAIASWQATIIIAWFVDEPISVHSQFALQYSCTMHVSQGSKLGSLKFARACSDILPEADIRERRRARFNQTEMLSRILHRSSTIRLKASKPSSRSATSLVMVLARLSPRWRRSGDYVNFERLRLL